MDQKSAGVRELVFLSTYAYRLHEDLEVSPSALTYDRLTKLCARAVFAVSRVSSIEDFDAKAADYKCQYLARVAPHWCDELPDDSRDRLLRWAILLDSVAGPVGIDKRPFRFFIERVAREGGIAREKWSGDHFWEIFATALVGSCWWSKDENTRRDIGWAGALRRFLNQSRDIIWDIHGFAFRELGLMQASETERPYTCIR